MHEGPLAMLCALNTPSSQGAAFERFETTQKTSERRLPWVTITFLSFIHHLAEVIVERVDLHDGDRVLGPACAYGSGGAPRRATI